jgi:hypothetical protein
MAHPSPFLPVPALPRVPERSPEVVQVMDRIRFELDKGQDADRYAEFYTFAREYPRHYRYLLDCAAHRMRSIEHCYRHMHAEFAEWLATKASDNHFETIQATPYIKTIYLDFDSFLVAVGSALDLVARILGPAYRHQTPISFNKFCNKENGEIAEILKKAQQHWVKRMKSYRDCTVHFTPMNNWPSLRLQRYSDGWELRAPIPTNPAVREAEFFRYSRRVELLKYVIATYRNLLALDRAVARSLKRLYESHLFPIRITGLLGV